MLSQRPTGGVRMIGSLEMAAALLLTGAGLAKLRSPGQAAAVVRRVSPWRGEAWSRAAPLAVRAAGLVEVGAGTAVVVTGYRLCTLLLGACYLAFALVVLALRRDRQHTSCGCFGRADSPVGAAHLVLNLTCLGASAAAFVRPPGSFGGLLGHGALPGVVATGQAVLLAYLGFLSITALPALGAARRQLLETR
jgi:hypothetical protein